MAKVQAKVGDAAGAKALAAQIDGDDRKAYAYADIVEVQTNAGDVTAAKATAAHIADARQKARAYTFIVEAQANAGDVAGAIAEVRKHVDDPRRRAELFAEAANQLLNK
jgi:hypothetical protein